MSVRQVCVYLALVAGLLWLQWQAQRLTEPCSVSEACGR